LVHVEYTELAAPGREGCPETGLSRGHGRLWSRRGAADQDGHEYLACELSHIGLTSDGARRFSRVGWVARRLGAQIEGLAEAGGPAAETGPGSR
jgi:hypothetical protein